MIHLFINGLSASAGGGLTYLRNVVPHLAAADGVRTTVAVTPALAAEFASLPHVAVVTVAGMNSAKRFWYEQTVLPGIIERSGADVLICAGNFGLRKSPVPQILLSRNALYTSSDFFSDLRTRREYAIWLDTRIKAVLAARSIRWADCTVAPSEAFASDLRRWTGRPVSTIYHGFDAELFFGNGAALPVDVQQQLDATNGSLRFLFVSHYNYYRNFETLLWAVAQLRARMPQVKLLLTCKLDPEHNTGDYHAGRAANLVEKLGLENNVVQLGTVPYASLHQVYKSADVYVTAAYAESFAHPLVEAMASGLPVVASDIPVHREICGDAALYFPRFSAADLADRIQHVAGNPRLRDALSARGRLRASDFSWEKHVQQMVELALELKHGCTSTSAASIDSRKISPAQIA